MIKTLSLLPRKTAQPPLVGKTARTCTSMTVLFIRANRISPLGKNKQGGSRVPPPSLRHRARARSFLVFEHEMKTGLVRRAQIFAMRACMSAAVIDYALCGRGRSRKNEDRVGR